MSDNTKVNTAYGEADLSKLIKAYEAKKNTTEASGEVCEGERGGPGKWESWNGGGLKLFC